MLTKNETVNGINITMTISGTIIEVREAIKQYFNDYAPEGYNSRIYSDVDDGITRTVKITRWSSCD